MKGAVSSTPTPESWAEFFILALKAQLISEMSTMDSFLWQFKGRHCQLHGEGLGVGVSSVHLLQFL